MLELARKINNHITANGKQYLINTDFRAALITWASFQAANDNEITQLSAVATAYNLMLNKDIEENFDEQEASAIIESLIQYFVKYSQVSENEKKDDRPPLISFKQDQVMIRDAFLLLGKDLYSDNIDYPTFMSLFRLLQTTDAPYVRILHLRELIRSGKIKLKQYKSEREEIAKIGKDIVHIKESKNKKEQAEIDARKLANLNRFRNVTVKQN